jgi:hypothetical protein
MFSSVFGCAVPIATMKHFKHALNIFQLTITPVHQSSDLLHALLALFGPFHMAFSPEHARKLKSAENHKTAAAKSAIIQIP